MSDIHWKVGDKISRPDMMLCIRKVTDDGNYLVSVNLWDDGRQSYVCINTDGLLVVSSDDLYRFLGGVNPIDVDKLIVYMINKMTQTKSSVSLCVRNMP